MKCRNNIAQLTPTQKSQIVQAFRDLKDPTKAPSRITVAQSAVTNGRRTPNRYDDYVWMHNMVGFGAHHGPAFGQWHRGLLLQLEFDLKQVSGDPQLTLPYWDWTTARRAPVPASRSPTTSWAAWQCRGPAHNGLCHHRFPVGGREHLPKPKEGFKSDRSEDRRRGSWTVLIRILRFGTKIPSGQR
jgi:hypothetical protein